MLKNAPIVILDEATAYIDPENEAVVQRAVAKLVEDKTVIVIAHRLSTITDADRIFVIDGGRVTASGTHEQLLKDSELYRKCGAPTSAQRMVTQHDRRFEKDLALRRQRTGEHR